MLPIVNSTWYTTYNPKLSLVIGVLHSHEAVQACYINNIASYEYKEIGRMFMEGQKPATRLKLSCEHVHRSGENTAVPSFFISINHLQTSVVFDANINMM